MKVLICDHADCMMPDHALEIETLRAGLGEDVEVEVLEYEDDKRDEFYEHVADADASRWMPRLWIARRSSRWFR